MARKTVNTLSVPLQSVFLVIQPSMGLANQLRNGKLGLGYVKAIKVFYFVFNVYLKTLMTVLLWIVCKYVLVTNEINYLNTYNIVKIGKMNARIVRRFLHTLNTKLYAVSPLSLYCKTVYEGEANYV